ncbi:MAG: sigma-54 interaction domain-containing protein [Spirochaetaceae bacterium]
MKPQFLCAWLGKTDISASEGNPKAAKGPIFEALEVGGYSALVLLSNYSKEESIGYKRWIEARLPELSVELYMVELSSPTEFAEIYESAVQVLEELASAHAEYGLTFHLSPGTPAMSATWILIASGKYRADLVETSREMGLRKVRLPFDILAEYHPRYGRRIDTQVLGMSDELLPATPAFDEIIHSSEIMKRTVNLARRVSFFDVPVLLLGESGTGKELFARAIHASSSRGGGPFISVNCGALPEGLVESELFGYVKGAFTGAGGDKKGYIESADGGTLFLDEIGELPLHVQVLLLRVLQDGTFRRIGSTRDISSDFRLISATNRPLAGDSSATGSVTGSPSTEGSQPLSEGFGTIPTAHNPPGRAHFRDDLFHRIAVGVIKIPPLRERGKDIQELTDFFLESINREFSRVDGYNPKRIGVDARKIISKHFWPGNVRELINTITRACLWSPEETIDAELLELSLIRREKERPEAHSNANKPEESAGTPGPKDAERAILNRPLDKELNIEELIDEVKRHYLRRAMEAADGSKVKAARLLGLSNYQTLSNWLEKYGIS